MSEQSELTARTDVARTGSTHFVSVPVTTGWVDPAAVRSIDAPMMLAEPDLARWLGALTFDERLDLLPRTSTQALLGEPVTVVSEEGAWAEVRLPWQPTSSNADGYATWLPAAHLSRWPDRPVDREYGIVSSRLTPARTVPSGAVRDVLSMGTVLPVGSRHDGLVELLCPSGSWWVRSSDVTTPAALRRTQRTKPGGSDFVDRAATMIGVPYLWAGLSGWGVDCSGLIHLVSRSLGYIVSRDSKDMRAEHSAAEHSAAGSVPVVGEQLFFRYRDERDRIHHIGLAAGDGLMLHAPRTGRVVELMGLTEEPYASELERALPSEPKPHR